MRRYYIKPNDFKDLVTGLFQKDGETLNLNWYEGFKDIEEGWFKETEPIWLGSVYATGQSESGIEYTRLVCDEENIEELLIALADKTKLDSGKLKLICTDSMPGEEGWPNNEVALCYENT